MRGLEQANSLRGVALDHEEMVVNEMSKMACHCGGIISNNSIPCPTESWILRDQDQDAYEVGACRDLVAFFAAVCHDRRDSWIAEYYSPQYPTDVSDDSIVYEILNRHKRELFLSMAECEQCGRLWVQCGPGINSYRSYSPDQPGYAGLLRLTV